MSNDVFARAVAGRKKEKEEEEERKSGNFGNYTKPEVLGLVKNQWVPFRIIGYPWEFRQKPTDPKLIYQSKILTDKEKFIFVNWPLNEDNRLDKDWILHQLYDTVTAYDWEAYPDGEKDENGNTGKKVYHHPDSKALRRINSNKKAKSQEKFPKKFKASARVIYNVDDPSDDWCKENKHSKILSSNHQFWKETDGGTPIYFTDTGVPKMVDEMILEEVVEFRGNYDIDIAVKKTKDQPFYQVKDAKETEKIPSAIAKVMRDEKIDYSDWELYDLDKQYPVTSYNKLLKHLSGLFKQVDGEFGTSFYDELVDLAKEEKEAWDAEKKENEKAKHENTDERFDDDDNDEGSSDVETEEEPEVKEEKPKARRSKAKAVAEKKEEDERDLTKTFPKFDVLTSEEKEALTSSIVRWEGNVPIHKNPEDNFLCEDEKCFYPDTTIQTQTPPELMHCPVCGMEFDAE